MGKVVISDSLKMWLKKEISKEIRKQLDRQKDSDFALRASNDESKPPRPDLFWKGDFLAEPLEPPVRNKVDDARAFKKIDDLESSVEEITANISPYFEKSSKNVRMQKSNKNTR